MAELKIKLFTLLLALSALAACNKEQNPPSEVIISASLSDRSKVSMDVPASGVGLALFWQQGDQLAVIGEGTELYSIKSGFSAHQAQFGGKKVTGSSFTILYPGQQYSSVAQINARSYAGQIQNGNGTTSHLCWNAMLEDQNDYAQIDFTKGKRNGVLKLIAVLEDTAETVQYVTVSTTSPVFYKTNDLDGGKMSELRLDFTNMTLDSSHTLKAYLMTSWNEVLLAPGEIMTVNIKVSDSEKYTMKIIVPTSGLTIGGGTVNVIRLYKDASGNYVATTESINWMGDFKW